MNSEIDNLSVPMLIQLALEQPDEEEPKYWDCVDVLQRRGTREVFEQAVQLCTTGKAREQSLGSSILAQLGFPTKIEEEEHKPFKDESIFPLSDVIAHPASEEALCSAISALGHLGDPRAIDPIVGFEAHPSQRVRFSVAWALPMLRSEEPSAKIIESLIRMTRDKHELVRDWATFALGTQLDVDTPEIRIALLDRITDADAITRGEAFRGLARRKDVRIVEALIHELTLPEVTDETLEACELLGDRRLLSALLELQRRSGESGWLESAIEKCRPCSV